MSISSNRSVIFSQSEGCNFIGDNAGTRMTDAISKIPSSNQHKVRRTVDEERAKKRVVSNCSIVASRGELSRNSFVVPEPPTPVKNKITIPSVKLLRRESAKKPEEAPNKKSPVLHRRASTNEKINARVPGSWRKPSNSVQTIPKSHSVPANLKDEYHCGSRRESPCRIPEVFLNHSASLLPSAGTTLAGREKNNSVDPAEDRSRTFSFLKDSFWLGKGKPRRSSENSSDFRILSNDWKKSPVKKSVSFSSDTTFKEKKSPHKRTAVHESKVYRKGVLQGRSAGEEVTRNVPPASDLSASGGLRALLRAAREGDDETLKKIIGRLQKSDSDEADFNLADSSGRTVISYMSEIGSSSMLEPTLSFAGINPNLPDNEGNTPLHFAAQAGQVECLNILLQRCPDINVDARNFLGFTPLMKAAIQGRTKCAKILLFAGANPTLRDSGRGLRAEQWARYCGRYVCSETIERFARHKLLEKTTSCRWGSEPELAVKLLQGKILPMPQNPLPPASTGLKSKIRRVFRSSSNSDRNFSLVSQLTSAALCASSPALPKPGDVPLVVKSLLRPLNVPQLRITLVAPPELIEKSAGDKCNTNFSETIENSTTKPARSRKKSK